MTNPSRMLQGYVAFCVLLLGTSLDQTLYQSFLRPMFGEAAFFSVRIPLGMFLLLPVLFWQMRGRERAKNLPSTIGLSLAFFALALLPGFFWAMDPLLHAGGVLMLILGLFLFWLSSTRPWVRDAVQWGVLLSAGVSSLVALGQVLTQRSLGLGMLGEVAVDAQVLGAAKGLFGFGDLLRGYGLFAHPNLAFAWIALALILVLGTSHRKPWRHPGSALFVVLLVLGLLATGAKSLLLLPLAWFGAMISKRFSFPMTVLIMGIPLLGALLLLQGVFGDAPSLTDRWYFMTQSLELLRSSPLGLGLGHMPAGLLALGETAPWMAQPVHVVFLLFFVELGLLGGLLVAGSFVMAAPRLLNPQGLTDLRLRTFFLFVVLSLCVDHYWWTSPSHFSLLALTSGLLLGPLLAHRPRRRYTTA